MGNNFLDLMFGPPRITGKEKFKGHPNHRSCDFGIKEFNKTKRNKGFVQEIRDAEKRRGKPPKNPPPPPPPPPPGTSERATILLDFDGALITGTAWNYNGDISADYSGLTFTEIEAILAAVQADYAQFNAVSERILITTDPAIYEATPVSRRARCVITESWEWYGQAGGVAFVNGFGDTQLSVGFVFSSLLGYSLKYIMEAVSHEVGHLLGCYHQSSYDANCVKTSDYNYGGNGTAPIMGVAYYQPEGRWIVGPNSFGCQSIQDDAAVIGAKLG